MGAISQPVAEVMNVVQKITTGDLSARVHVARSDEVGQLVKSFNDMADYIAEFTNNLSRNVALLSIVEEENRRVAAVHSVNEMIQVVEAGLFRLQKATGCWLSFYLAESFQPETQELNVVDSDGKVRRSLPADANAFYAVGSRLRIFICHYEKVETILGESEPWLMLPVIVREGFHFKHEFDISIVDRVLGAYALAVAGAMKTIDAIELQARHARVSAEIETARAVQEGLLPHKITVLNMDVVALYQPVHHIGGDWHGYHFDPKSRFAYYYIGDITGHGFASALITGVVFGCVNAVNGYFADENQEQPRPEVHLERLADILNRVVYKVGLGQLMMTFLALAVDVETGRALCLNAGHRHGLWLRKTHKSVAGLGMVPAMPLGCDATPSRRYRCSEVDLERGDVICLFTDGLVENLTTTGERIKWRDIKDTLLTSDSLAMTVDRIKGLTDDFWVERRGKDDATIMLCQWG